MSKVAEIKEKIAKAEKNKMLPENLKKAIIKKLETELAQEESKSSKVEHKAAPKAKVAPKSPHKEPEPDCEELLENELKRKKQNKKSAAKSNAKPAAVKSKDAIEGVGERIEKQYEEGELTRAEIEKLIATLTKQLAHLKTLLKTATNKSSHKGAKKMGGGGVVGAEPAKEFDIHGNDLVGKQFSQGEKGFFTKPKVFEVMKYKPDYVSYHLKQVGGNMERVVEIEDLKKDYKPLF